MSMLGLSIALGVATAYGLLGSLSLGDFRGIVLVLAGVVFIYLVAFSDLSTVSACTAAGRGRGQAGDARRVCGPGQYPGSFYLLLFNTLIRTHFLPVPVMRLVYLALGARLGANTYSAGVLLDPALTELGANCIVGHDAVLYSHAIEGEHFSLARIRIGDKVTIGACAIVMSGVTIGDGAIVSAGAVVLKDTRIAAGEVWGGVPARRLR